MGNKRPYTTKLDKLIKDIISDKDPNIKKALQSHNPDEIHNMLINKRWTESEIKAITNDWKRINTHDPDPLGEGFWSF